MRYIGNNRGVACRFSTEQVMENVSEAGPKEYRGEWHYGEFLIGMEWSAQVFLKLELEG